MGKYVTIFDAKPETTMEEIHKAREAWVSAGKERELEMRCKSIQRYEVIGTTPLRVVFVVDTEDPIVLTELAMHFGNAWECATYPVVERKVSEILREDTSVTCG